MNSAKQFLKSLTANLAQETWWFTEHELSATVRSVHDAWSDDPFVAYPAGAEKGIIVFRNGIVTNVWEDGEHGVPESLKEAAESAELVQKPTFNTPYGTNWAVDETDEDATEKRRVYVDAEGRFAGFVVSEGVAKDFLKQVAKQEHERWCFTEYELEHPERCRGTDEFCADVSEDESLMVIVLRNGSVTNRWEDGTVGVPPHLQDLADFQDFLYKRDRRNAHGSTDIIAETWRDVVTKGGQFDRFQGPSMDFGPWRGPLAQESTAKAFLRSTLPRWVVELHEMGWETGHAASRDVRQFTLRGFYVRNYANPWGRVVLYVSPTMDKGFVQIALHDQHCWAPPIGVIELHWQDFKACLAHWQNKLEFTLPEDDDSRLPTLDQWKYSWNELRKHLKAHAA